MRGFSVLEDVPRSSVDHWETVEVLHSEKKNGSGQFNELGVSVEVQRPIFSDGREGRVGLSVVFRRGDRLLRLNCPNGSMQEVSSFLDMISGLTPERLDLFGREFEVIRKRYNGQSRRDRSDVGVQPGADSQRGYGNLPSFRRRRRKGFEQ